MKKYIYFSLFAFLFTNSVNATLINGVIITDTTKNLEITWSGAWLDAGGDDVNLSIAGLANWSVPLAVLRYLGGGNGWTGSLAVSHNAKPHAADAGIGSTANLDVAFKQLVDTTDSVLQVVNHLVPHSDKYVFNYKYTPDIFFARLTGMHVPEPTSLALFCIGLVGLSFSRKKRLGRLPNSAS